MSEKSAKSDNTNDPEEVVETEEPEETEEEAPDEEASWGRMQKMMSDTIDERLAAWQ